MLVTGEAGIGKTRLVGELARRADNAGARVAVGAGVDVGGEAPLQLWEELARALATVVPRPPEPLGWPAELGRLAPDLARALGRQGTPPLVAAPELERLRVFDAVLRLVEWAAAGRPVLLVAEDVHRADRASLALCAHIGRRLAALPVLFVLTRRDRPARSDADALLADLASRGVEVTEVELGPLPGGRWPRWCARVAALPAAAVDGWSRRPTATRCWRWRAPGRRPRAGWTARRPRPTCGRWCGPRSAGCPRTRGRSRRPSRPPGVGCPRRRSRRCPGAVPTSGRHRRSRTARARLRAAAPRAAAACATGTRCSPRPPAPTCATRRARTWRSRWRWRPAAAPSTPGRPRWPTTCGGRAATTSPHPAGGGPPGTPAPSAPCRRRPRSGPKPCAATPTTPPRASSSSRCTPGRAGPRSSSGSGPPRSPASPRRRGRRVASAGAAPQDRRCATRPPPSRPTAAPRSCSARTRPPRCGRRCSSAWRGTRAPRATRSRRTPCSPRCGSWSRRAACRRAWRTSWWPRPSPPG